MPPDKRNGKVAGSRFRHQLVMMTAAPDSNGQRAEITGPRRLLETVGLIAAPLTFITATLYWFGWNAANSYFGYFGVDLSLTDLTPIDYLLQSADVLILPLGILLFAAILFVLTNSYLRRLSTKRGRLGAVILRATFLGSLFASVLLLCFGFFRLAMIGPYSSVVAPICLGAGALLAEYAFAIRRLYGSSTIDTVQRPLEESPRIRRALVVAVVVLAAFWGTGVYAQYRGLERAAGFVGSSCHSILILKTKEPIQILDPGVRRVDIGSNPDILRYQYSGLRLLARTKTGWILVPEQWQVSRLSGGLPTVVVLSAESDSVRVEVAAGSTPGGTNSGSCSQRRFL